MRSLVKSITGCKINKLSINYIKTEFTLITKKES